MKRPYIKISACPNCGSSITGRYVKPPFTDRDYMMISSLKNGEIIVFRDPEPINNAFCLECGHEWPEQIRTSWITKEERSEEIIKRGTEEMLNAYIETNQIQTKRRHNPLRGWFGGWLGS